MTCDCCGISQPELALRAPEKSQLTFGTNKKPRFHSKARFMSNFVPRQSSRREGAILRVPPCGRVAGRPVRGPVITGADFARCETARGCCIVSGGHAWRRDSRSIHAQPRAKHICNPDRPRYADGRDVSPLLDSGDACRGIAGERVPAGADQASIGAAARLARYPGPPRADRRVLRPSRRVAVVRAERARWTALPLSRLEI